MTRIEADTELLEACREALEHAPRAEEGPVTAVWLMKYGMWLSDYVLPALIQLNERLGVK